MSPFQRVLEYAKAYKKYFVLNVVCNLLYSILSVVSIYSMLPLLKVLLDPEMANDPKLSVPPVYTGGFTQYFGHLKDLVYHNIYVWMNEVGKVEALTYICAIVLVAFFFRNVFRYFAAYFMIALRTSTSRDIRNDLYRKILSLPVAFFTEQRKGDLMARISGDVANVEHSLLSPLAELFRAPFMLVITLFGLAFMNYQLTLFALIVLPIIAFVISMISKSLKKDARKSQDELGQLLSYTEETLGASKIIKIFNAHGRLQERFAKSVDNWRALTTRVIRKADLSSPSSEFLGSVAMILLVWFGAKLILDGEGSMDGSAFLVFIGLFFQIIEPAKTLAKSISEIAKGSASAERILEVLDSDETVLESQEPVKLETFKKSIEFKNIWFSYDGEEQVIKDFNLKINKGESVALVGQSGSGKSTLANLITRFYDVQKGEILVDGVNVKDLDLKSYRELIGMVTQDSILFNDTVENNLLIGNPKASAAEMKQACETANAAEFIENLPGKYLENIGEGGGKLSGGQKQRLSIARAVLKNPPIMVLDEATSALDSQSERHVQAALDGMMENRTSMVIAHRLSTIQNATKIVVLEKGKIIEEGTHASLLSTDGMYAKLIQMQNFG